MGRQAFTLGIDFGTESGRATLVDVATGQELCTAVHAYGHGVIDDRLPETSMHLPPDWALQDPDDYLETLTRVIAEVIRHSGVDPTDVIGLGIDFTACTILPTKIDGTPLCRLREYRPNPQA